MHSELEDGADVPRDVASDANEAAPPVAWENTEPAPAVIELKTGGTWLRGDPQREEGRRLTLPFLLDMSGRHDNSGKKAATGNDSKSGEHVERRNCVR